MSSSNAAPPVLHSVFDDYASRIDPSHVPISQETLKMLLFLGGATEDTLLEHLAMHNKMWQDTLDRCGGELPLVGVCTTSLSFYSRKR